MAVSIPGDLEPIGWPTRDVTTEHQTFARSSATIVVANGAKRSIHGGPTPKRTTPQNCRFAAFLRGL